MKQFKDDFNNLRPWLILVSYIFLLCLILIKFDYIILVINTIMIIVKPFFYSLLVAYVFNIPMVKIESFISNNINNKYIVKISRIISIVIIIIISLILLSFLLLFITPQIANSVFYLISNIGGFFSNIVDNITYLLEFFNIEVDLDVLNTNQIELIFENYGIDLNKVLGTASDVITSAGYGIFHNIIVISDGLITAFISFILSIYLLYSKEIFIVQSKKLIASILSFDLYNRLFVHLKKVNTIFTGFIGGQLVDACILGLLIYIMMTFTNMPYSLLISTIVSLMSLVPVFGSIFAMVIGFILILSVSPITALWFILLFEFVQVFENNFIYPKVVGKSVGLPALWTLVSILLFGGLFGILGMLLAVPVTACIYVIGSELVNRSLKKKKIIIDKDSLRLDD